MRDSEMPVSRIWQWSIFFSYSFKKKKTLDLKKIKPLVRVRSQNSLCSQYLGNDEPFLLGDRTDFFQTQRLDSGRWQALAFLGGS